MTQGSPDPAPKPPESLHDLLVAMAPQADEERVYVRDVLNRVGSQSFPAVILVPAIVLVSPVSGIPGSPTIGALIVLLTAIQALLRRKQLWLPEFLTKRSISSERMRKGIQWLTKPAAWMDRHSHGRFRILTAGPLKLIAYAVATLSALSWPLLEIVPFVTSFSAGAVAMIMFGMMTRDGAYLVAGYVQSAAIYLTILTIWSGLLGS